MKCSINKGKLTHRLRRKVPLLALTVAAMAAIGTSNAAFAQVHEHDHMKRDEHEAVLNLVPTAYSTHVAANSGNWSSATTWQGGSVPGAGARVYIPADKTVIYDVNSSVSIFSIRIDGILQFSTSANTRLVVDTAVVAPGGTWRQGTAAAPIPAYVTSNVIFSDNGPIDMNWDPRLFSRGLISHGNLSIYGAAKTAFVKVPYAQAGATTLNMSSAPSGWNVGDTVILSGVKMLKSATTGATTNQDEIRQITNISGTTVTLNAPLTYNHVPPQSASPVPLTNYLANYSRNITFESANKDTVNNANIQRKGHFMAMHSTNVAVYYAAFNDMGRSNKELLVNDPPSIPMRVWENFTDDNGVFRAEGTTITGNGSNARGRYSMHLHMCGSEDNNDSADGTGPIYTYTKPIIVKGCSILNGPGWGFTNHNSHVNFYENVAYGLKGAAFVEESGNGIGIFQDSLAMRSGSSVRDRWNNGDPREHLGLLDLGHAGHGFFYRGNMVDTVRCISTSSDSSGYNWVGKHGAGGSPISAQTFRYPAVTNGMEKVPWDLTPVSIFRDNVAIASIRAVDEYYSQPTGDARSHIENTVGWNILGEGIVVNYGNFSGQVTVSNSVLIADTDYGQYETGSRAVNGIAVLNTFNDLILDNNYIHGFQRGFRVENGGNGVRKVGVVNNQTFVNCGTNYSDPYGLITYFNNPSNRSVLSFTPDSTQSWSGVFGHGYNLKGTKTDPLGSERTGDILNDYISNHVNRFRFPSEALRSLLAKGYFSDSGGYYIVLPYAVTNRLTLVVNTYYHKLYLNLANYGNEVIGPHLGAFTAPDTQTVPRPYVTLPGGSYPTGQTVKLVNPLPGVYYYYTTDGSTPGQNSNGDPIGTSKLYTTGSTITLPGGTTTLRAIGYAGVMTPSAITTVTYTLPGGPTPTPTPTPTATPTPTPTPPVGTGSITRDVWTGISGTAVSAIPVTTTPSSTGTITSFEAPSNIGDNYGQRVRGYLVPSTTGSYTFWIAGDDNVELYLSSNNQADSKTRIAYHTGWTGSRVWNTYSTQKSAAITLQSGQQYYIEALMKEGGGSDNLAVGWAKPGQSTTAPSEVIPGSALSPYTTTSNNQLLNEGNFGSINQGSFTAGTSTNNVFYSQVGSSHATRSATGGNADAYLKLGAYGNQVCVGLPGSSTAQSWTVFFDQKIASSWGGPTFRAMALSSGQSLGYAYGGATAGTVLTTQSTGVQALWTNKSYTISVPANTHTVVLSWFTDSDTGGIDNVKVIKN